MPSDGMTRLEALEHRQLTDEETQRLRQQARQAISDDPDVVEFVEEGFHLPRTTIKSLLFRTEFDYAEELAGGTKVLEWTEAIDLRDSDEQGYLTVHVEALPDSDDVEAVLVETRV